MGLGVIHEVHIKSNMHYLPNAFNFLTVWNNFPVTSPLPVGFGEFYDEKDLNFLISCHASQFGNKSAIKKTD